MSNFQHKNIKNNIWHSWPVLIGFATVLIFFALGIVELIQKTSLTGRNRNLAENNVSELESRKYDLERNIDQLNTAEGKEKIFRENYGLAKAGENVVLIIDEENSDTDKKKHNAGFWGFLNNIFK